MREGRESPDPHSLMFQRDKGKWMDRSEGKWVGGLLTDVSDPGEGKRVQGQAEGKGEREHGSGVSRPTDD